MEVLSDKRHRTLLNSLVVDLKTADKKYVQGTKYFIEHYYNHYGQRGFIDLLTKSNDSLINIFEVKPNLENLGEALRQLNRSEDVIKKHAIDEMDYWDNRILKKIVTYLNKENYKIVLDSWSILNETSIGIIFFCEKNDKNDLFWPIHYKEYDVYFEMLNSVCIEICLPSLYNSNLFWGICE